MAIDLSRFIATFFDEAQEHLESLEERAMTLGQGAADSETLNAIFRAAHSIKGGSGTFGFTQLTEATHEMETLFDALRKGEGVADASTVRLLLDACDVFKAHLARLKGGQKGADPAMDALRATLIAYRAGRAGAAKPVTPAPPAPASRKPGAGPQSSRTRKKEAPTEEAFFTDEPAPARASAPPAAAAKPAAAYGFFDDARAALPPRRSTGTRTRNTACSSPPAPRRPASRTAARATPPRSAWVSRRSTAS